MLFHFVPITLGSDAQLYLSSSLPCMTDKRFRRRNNALIKLDVAKVCCVVTGECTKALVKSARVEHDFEAKHET